MLFIAEISRLAAHSPCGGSCLGSAWPCLLQDVKNRVLVRKVFPHHRGENAFESAANPRGIERSLERTPHIHNQGGEKASPPARRRSLRTPSPRACLARQGPHAWIPAAPLVPHHVLRSGGTIRTPPAPSSATGSGCSAGLTAGPGAVRGTELPRPKHSERG